MYEYRGLDSPSQPEAFLQTVYGDFQTVELTYVDKTAAKIRADID